LFVRVILIRPYILFLKKCVINDINDRSRGMEIMEHQEMEKIEAEIKRQKGTGADAENLYAGITNGIPNQKDNSPDHDALNANFVKGEVRGTHDVNINSQTDLELGGIADPGGIDPAYEEQLMAASMRKIREKASK
jgi:hypothetical protein